MNQRYLLDLREELVDTIMNYESDTFSARASKITQEEAEQIADIKIITAIKGMIECDTMDGVMVREELSYIREDE